MKKKIENKHTFIGLDKNFNNSNIVYFGAPYDGTSSFRPGTRFAPKVIRNFSYSLETYSNIFKKDLVKDSFVFDYGDLELPINNIRKTLNIISKFTRKIVSSKKKPFLVGGEHLVSLPVIKCLFDYYKDLYVIHFDAHLDLRDKYIDDKFSHATVIRRVFEFLGKNKIYQYGIRSGTREEFEFAKKNCILEFFENDNFLKNFLKKIGRKPVYITFDLDIFDPGMVSGVGTPEPGGFDLKKILKIFYKLSSLNIVGADIVELSPEYDSSSISTIYACKVIRELIFLMN